MNGPKLVDRAPIRADLSTAVIGESESGKTTLIRLLSYQMPVSSGTAVVAHDFDRDYQNLFTDLGLEAICLRKDDSDAVWNVFEDFNQENYRELASLLIGSPDDADATARHFNNLAVGLLETVLNHLHREGERQGEQPTNAHLKKLTIDITNEQLASELEDDYPAQADSISGTDKGESIHSTMKSALGSKLVGDFGKAGSFSLKNYLRNPDGRVLVVDTEVGSLRTMDAGFSLLIDQAIRFAMDDSEVTCNFILDEIDTIKTPIPSVPDLASKGRGRDARCLIGIQTVGQLHNIYGKGSGVLGNCPQEIHMASGDPASNRYARKAVGKRMTTEITHSTSETEHGTTVSSSESRKERNPISEGALNDFATGDAVVINQESWWMCHIAQFESIRDRLPCGVDVDGAAEMMDFLDKHFDGDEDGPGGGATSPPSQSETVQDDERPAVSRDTESHPAESDGWLRRVTGLRSEETGLTDAGRRAGYGNGEQR
jgi:ABC-type oligopeptide transport system ATPase subunit